MTKQEARGSQLQVVTGPLLSHRPPVSIKRTTQPSEGRLPSRRGKLNAYYRTRLGVLFHGDCLDILPFISDESVDTVFADPPFNIGKEYGRRVNDRMSDGDYLKWCGKWMDECIRILKPGGAFFLYNIPRWNIRLSNVLLDRGLHFRDWIVVDLKLGLPIAGRLYPSHYSLLYFSKGKPQTFHNIRVPIKKCRHCGRDVKDYGGHRASLNPRGLNLSDVWTDIPPVRHRRFKSPKRKANALSSKLLDRIVEMTTDVHGVVLDPFGGSGTTFAVCEKKKRRWVGIELESADVIVDRLEKKDVHDYQNEDLMDPPRHS
ncbi:MAG TPA: site-specific DNA-methyltransferase [Chthoniobacterales bacterium]|nr:site-specific DNA-methyltransferase [Chthoniobacterales bacterium]